MLNSASATFRKALPEAIAALVQAMREYPQLPYGRPAHASGATERSFAGTADDEGLELTGPAYLQAQITGRGPTRGGGGGGTPLHTILEQWAMVKPGFTLRRGQTYRSVGFALANRIHKSGTALYRSGQTSGIIQSVFTKEWLTNLKASIAAGEMVAISSALTHAIQGS